MKNVKWDTGRHRGGLVSLSVALAGTEGQFQFPLLTSVGLCMCAFWCVYVWVLLLGFFFFVVFCFFFLNKEKMCIFLARTET